MHRLEHEQHQDRQESLPAARVLRVGAFLAGVRLDGTREPARPDGAAETTPTDVKE